MIYTQPNIQEERKQHLTKQVNNCHNNNNLSDPLHQVFGQDFGLLYNMDFKIILNIVQVETLIAKLSRAATDGLDLDIVTI